MSAPIAAAPSVSARRCQLLLLAPDGGTTEFTFDQPEVTLGALPDNDVVLDDNRASRHHARLLVDGDAFVIQDLHATSGTWVDGVRVREAWLRSGCMLQLGRTRLRFTDLSAVVAADLADAPQPALAPLAALVGDSETMRRLKTTLAKVAPTGSTVVLEGETGTGKEVVARTLHQLSARAHRPFVVVDCGAVQANLIESELFGHEKGSFTGAQTARMGLFEAAQGGTVFLDEVGELPLDLQPKLLRALETREIRRVGGNRPMAIDVRVVAATHRDLPAEVASGRFREDLFYRLGVVRLAVPPLRERAEDIAPLVRHLLLTGAFNRDPLRPQQARVRGVVPDALAVLMAHPWPGNVRELGNVVERACALCEGDVVTLDDLPPSLRRPPAPRPRVFAQEPTVPLTPSAGPSLGPAVALHDDDNFHQAKEKWLAVLEHAYVAALLDRHQGNVSQAARAADVDRKHFRRLARKYTLLPVRTDDDHD